jgi:RNA polymerase-binding transcription factor DksA
MPAKKPAKKAVPVKKPAAKPAPAKKAAPAKKPVAKPAPAKKAAAKPVAKPAPVKKVVAPVPTKKPAPVAVAKPAPAKKAVAPAPEKPVAKPVAVVPQPKAAAPAAKPTAVAKPAKPAKAAAKPSKKGKLILKARDVSLATNKPIVEQPKAVPIQPLPMKPLVAKPKFEPVTKEVKVPKINTKTSVPYEPGYTPMEKRVEIAEPTSPLIRYSDSELTEFREIINKKLDAAKRELAYLQGLITRKDTGGEDVDARYMTMEDGSMSMEREQLSQMASRQITYIDHLEKAIMRIENKTYGVCRVTGKLIDKARLRAVPHATLSLEAKLGLVKPAGAE